MMTIDPEVLKWRKNVVDVLVNRKHTQNNWLTPSQFISRVKSRDLGSIIDTSRLEMWDKLGIFHPAVRYYYPTTIHRKRSNTYWDKEPFVGEIVEPSNFIKVTLNGWRPEHINKPEYAGRYDELLKVPYIDNFVPAKDYEIKNVVGRLNMGGVYYHPYQIFRFEEAVNAAKISCTFSDFNVNGDIVDFFQTQLNQSRQGLAERELWDLKRLHLLALIEDRYLPRWRGVRYQNLVNSNHEAETTWHEWANEFDAASTLTKTLLTVEEIKQTRERFALHAYALDPNRLFYLLFRHFPYEKQQKLKGKALLAWDYYEAVEMLGWFLEDATGEKQRCTDDFDGSQGTWKKAWYEVDAEDIDFDSGNILRRLLLEYMIDPVYKLLLIVEGPSEEIFIKTWCQIHGLNLSHLGIRIYVLNGVKELNSERAKQAVKQAKTDHAAVVMVLDNDKEFDTRVVLEQWKKERLINKIFEVEDLEYPNRPLGALIWEKDYEEDNFDLDDLLEAWRLWLLEKNPAVLIDPDAMRSQVITERKNCNSWLEAMGVAHRTLQYLKGEKSKEVVNKVAISRLLASVIKKKQPPIVKLILSCHDIAMRATIYGPAHPDGGFGYAQLSNDE